MQQKLDQKHNQDEQQQSQKLDMIKKELQKYRELKKSPSFTNHLSSKQFQNCSELEKRKKIFSYINSNHIGQENLNLSSINPPQSSRNFKEQQQQVNKRENDSQVHQKSFIVEQNNYFTSNKRNSDLEVKTQGNKSMSISHTNQQDNNKKIQNGNSRSSNSIKNQNKEYFREITLADVQNFDMENQQAYFNEALYQQKDFESNKNYLEEEIGRNTPNNSIGAQYIDANLDIQQQQFYNNFDANKNLEQDFCNKNVDQNDEELLTFEDLRVKHQGTFIFKDLNCNNNNEEKDKKAKQNLTLQNLEDYHQNQSSYASTLISSGRNDNDKYQMLNQQISNRSQQQHILTSQNTLSSQMSQKLRSIGSGRLNQSNQSDQQIPFLKECLSTSTNSKQQLSSNHTISSKNKINSKDSQAYLDCSQPRYLNILPENQEQLTRIQQHLRIPIEDKEYQNNFQNSLNKTSPKVASNKIQSVQNSSSKRQSLHNSLASPPVSPKANLSICNKKNKSYFQSDTKRLTVSVSPNSKTQNGKSIHKDNKSKGSHEFQDKKDDIFVQSKCQKLNAILQEKSNTVKNISSTNSNNQPYFKSIRHRNDKTPPSNRQLDRQNVSNSKIIQQNVNASLISQDKTKQFSNIGKSAPSKPTPIPAQNPNHQLTNQTPQNQQIKQEDLQYQQKQNFIERRLTEEQERWKEIGTQMVLAYEELNQNFKLLVKQKKQQDIMLQQLVESLAQKEAVERSCQNLSPKNVGDDNSEFSSRGEESHKQKYSQQQSDSSQDLQMVEIISEIQSKLFKKFDKHDSIQIQTLLNQFNKVDKKNKDYKSKQKDIERIVNAQVKESSSLADQIIHLRTQLDKACITMMKNQKESSYQFSSMLQMLHANKNSIIFQQNAQSMILQEESFNPNLGQSIIKQIDQTQNLSLGSMFSPVNSKQILNNQQSNQQGNAYGNIYNENEEFRENATDNKIVNQFYCQNLNQVQSYIQFNNYADTSYGKQLDLSDNLQYKPVLSQQQGYNNQQNQSFEIESPIRSDRVPFFGEMIHNENNSIDTNEEIHFQAEYN